MLHVNRRSFAICLSHFLLFICLFTYTGGAQTMPGLAPNQLVLPSQNQELKWQWLGDTTGTNWEPHAAMLIPVTLPGCSKQFYMQFDLGAASSIFYRDQVEQIKARYLKTFTKQDSLSTLTNFTFQVDKTNIQAGKIAVVSRTLYSPLINWADKKSITIIGTLGADLIENKVIAIDYVTNRLHIGDSLPAALSSALPVHEFYFARRSVLLPATVNGKKTLLLFDTGSSAYTLLTDKATGHSLTDANSTWQTYPVTSWNRVLTANTSSTKAKIEIASQVLPINHVTYMEGASSQQIDQMMKLGIGGMTGNKLFLNSILVLDTKNKKFGLVVKEKE
jgi:hypothetical protein